MTTQSSLFALAVAASAALPLVACSDERIFTPQPVAGASGQAATAGGPGSGGNASAGSATQTAGTSAAGTRYSGSRAPRYARSSAGVTPSARRAAK